MLEAHLESKDDELRALSGYIRIDDVRSSLGLASSTKIGPPRSADPKPSMTAVGRQFIDVKAHAGIASTIHETLPAVFCIAGIGSVKRALAQPSLSDAPVLVYQEACEAFAELMLMLSESGSCPADVVLTHLYVYPSIELCGCGQCFPNRAVK